MTLQQQQQVQTVKLTVMTHVLHQSPQRIWKTSWGAARGRTKPRQLQRGGGAGRV